MNELVPPKDDPNKKAILTGLGDIGLEISEEVKRRLDDKKYFRKMDTGQLMDYLLRIASVLNKTPTLINPTFIGNLNAANDRVKELDSHPARRKELRAKVVRLNGIPR